MTEIKSGLKENDLIINDGLRQVEDGQIVKVILPKFKLIMNKGFKEFLPSSWAIDYSTVVYVLIFIFFILGFSHICATRENFQK